MPAAARRASAYRFYPGSAQFRYQYRIGPCFPLPGRRFDPRCLALSRTRRNVVVFGDSYAAQLWRAIALRQPQDNVLQATAAACQPLLAEVGRPSCAPFRQGVLSTLRRGGVARVVLAARWHPGLLPQLLQTVATIRALGVPVTVIGPTAEFDTMVPRLVAEALIRNEPRRMERYADPERRRLDSEMEKEVRAAGADYVSAYGIECPSGRCRLLAGDAPYHFDNGHLTLAGARAIAQGFPRF